MIEQIGPYIAPTAVVVGLTGWLWRLHGKSDENHRRLMAIERSLERLHQRADKLSERTALLEQRTEVMRGMMEPSTVAQYHRWSSAVEVRLTALEKGTK